MYNFLIDLTSDANYMHGCKLDAWIIVTDTEIMTVFTTF
jgi:hypothetical protein